MKIKEGDETVGVCTTHRENEKYLNITDHFVKIVVDEGIILKLILNTVPGRGVDPTGSR
jgi:hypothetical protein